MTADDVGVRRSWRARSRARAASRSKPTRTSASGAASPCGCGPAACTPTTTTARFLDRSPSEYERLRDALTINVTRFYRNAETWNLFAARRAARAARRRRGRGAGLERGLLLGRGAVHARHARRRSSRSRRPRRRAGPARRSTRPTSIARASTAPQAATYRREGLSEMPDELVRTYFEPAGRRAPGRRSRTPSGAGPDRST